VKRYVKSTRKERTVKKKYSKKDLTEFKKLILKKKSDTVDQIKHMSEDTMKKSPKEAAGDISSYTYHMADIATDTYDREFTMSLASNDRALMYEIEEALKKITDGTYGVCEECKDLISKVRLKAIPYARLCLKCQEKKEK